MWHSKILLTGRKERQAAKEERGRRPRQARDRARLETKQDLKS